MRGLWLARAQGSQALDLDLAVLGQPPLTLSELAALAEAFQDSDLPFKVDVLDFASTAESFRRVIEAERVVLVGGG